MVCIVRIVKPESVNEKCHIFLTRFKPGGFFPNKTYHVPRCTGDKCSDFYHDQEQTPQEQPPQSPMNECDCTKECDCGPGLPCGEYLWDHRNGSMLREWLVNEFIGGANGLANPLVGAGGGLMDVEGQCRPRY